jgi:hydroxymethylglutaryl-CoA lyase
VEAAVDAGCKRFDGALKGIGGCPMAGNDLIGNLNTEWMIRYFKDRNVLGSQLNEDALAKSIRLAEQVFI